jgi:FkbM family methyltransferase
MTLRSSALGRVRQFAKSCAAGGAGLLGFEIRRKRAQTSARRLETLFDSLLWLRDLSSEERTNDYAFVEYCAAHIGKSRSQLFQDLFVLHHLGEQRNGYFVEFGATNGVALSNTYLLEREYGWNGILAEPARCWHEALRNNRKCTIDIRCVWSKTGERLSFNETSAPEFSTISSYSLVDYHAKQRVNGAAYMVETVSLPDLLASHGAPKTIDYLSVDTEGSEFDILSNFDFNDRNVRVITVEHNHSEKQRDRIFALLTENGYRRVFEGFSHFDDWYVKIT